MPRRPYADTFTSPAALARFGLTVAVGLTLDLWTKSVAVTNLASGRIVEQPWMRGWLQFEYVANRGAVFGIAQGRTYIFLAVSAAAMAFLAYLFAFSGRKPVYQVILGMLLAGVLGNMYDRVRFAQVRDMIHALPGWQWPVGVHRVLPFLPADVFPYIFNVADTLLCVGVGLMLVYNFFNAPDARPRPDPSPAGGVPTPAEA